MKMGKKVRKYLGVISMVAIPLMGCTFSSQAQPMQIVWDKNEVILEESIVSRLNSIAEYKSKNMLAVYIVRGEKIIGMYPNSNKEAIKYMAMEIKKNDLIVVTELEEKEKLIQNYFEEIRQYEYNKAKYNNELQYLTIIDTKIKGLHKGLKVFLVSEINMLITDKENKEKSGK